MKKKIKFNNRHYIKKHISVKKEGSPKNIGAKFAKVYVLQICISCSLYFSKMFQKIKLISFLFFMIIDNIHWVIVSISLKLIFAKILKITNSRKFMFAKCKNFANYFPVTKSFCSRKVSTA